MIMAVTKCYNEKLQKLSELNFSISMKWFYYMGAKVYSDLPIDIRTVKNKKDFKEKLELFLKME